MSSPLQEPYRPSQDKDGVGKVKDAIRGWLPVYQRSDVARYQFAGRRRYQSRSNMERSDSIVDGYQTVSIQIP